MQDQNQHVKLAVEGMTCAGCTRAVENAIREVPGVQNATVDLESRQAQVDGTGLDNAKLVEAVKEAGFEAQISQ